ncbi:MAG: Pectate lyase superfamily protein [Tenericutes bacterium ADurb.Bin239]|nr:MAG: Pectate lyase superfamily protein [Tenericutes bacterium ADurb.Bin239]
MKKVLKLKIMTLLLFVGGLSASLVTKHHLAIQIGVALKEKNDMRKKVKVLVNGSGPELILNEKYPTADVFVADIVLDAAHGFTIDNTGNTPINDVLQAAIDSLYQNGGGTIYLPAGKYSITERINVRPFINIRGDYKDPDTVTDGDYGTVILCNVVPSKTEATGARINVFRMYGSTGLMGLTFFYPMQFLDVYKEYGFTIEIPGGLSEDMHNVFNLHDITFLNSYRGIGASVTPAGYYSITHEQLHLSNIKGTCLRVGAYLTNSSEVGTFDNIIFNNRYWANAGEEYNAPDIRNLNDFTTKNGVGMILGDLEWQEITNVFLTDYHTGIYFIDGTRNTEYHMAFIGQFYNLHIVNAKYGIYVEKLYQNMGIEFFKCRVEGSAYAMINHSPVNFGCLKVAFSDLIGEVTGHNIFISDGGYNDIELVPWQEPNYVKPRLVLYDAVNEYNADNSGQNDCSVEIQAALDAAHTDGGGVVYLPAGFYRLDHPLTVYANTQLRGCNNTLAQCQRYNSRGTFILAYYGLDDVTPTTGQALITLDGNKAGVSGLRIGYPALNPYKTLYTGATLPKYRYAIRGIGNDIYVTNVYIPGAYNGLEITGDRFVLRKVLGCFYKSAFKVSGHDGLISACLCNGACTLKPGSTLISDYDEWGGNTERPPKLWSNVYTLTRELGTVLEANECENLLVYHLFSFAYNTFIKTYKASVTAINMGFDSQPVGRGANFILKNNSTINCYNSLRDNCSQDGTYFTSDETSSLTVYNVILLLPNNAGRLKANIINNEYVAVDPQPNTAEVQLEKVWLTDVTYEHINYPDDGNGGGDGSSSSSEEGGGGGSTPNFGKPLIIGGSFVAIGTFAALFIHFLRKRGRRS